MSDWSDIKLIKYLKNLDLDASKSDPRVYRNKEQPDSRVKFVENKKEEQISRIKKALGSKKRGILDILKNLPKAYWKRVKPHQDALIEELKDYLNDE